MHKGRARRIEVVRRRLLRKSVPRSQVSLILALTALAGFLTSFSLLHLGVYRMWVRYPVAILIAYFVFLLLLAVWLWSQRRVLVGQWKNSADAKRYIPMFWSRFPEGENIIDNWNSLLANP